MNEKKIKHLLVRYSDAFMDISDKQRRHKMIVEIKLRMHLKDGVSDKVATEAVLAVAESVCSDVAVLEQENKRAYCQLFKAAGRMRCFKCYAAGWEDAVEQFKLSYGCEPVYVCQTEDADTAAFEYKKTQTQEA